MNLETPLLAAPREGADRSGPPRQFWRTRWISFTAWAAIYFLIALGLNWRNGAYRSGFGSYPDESGHYVTGLMVYKYLTTATLTNPMTFAEHFYSHYPAVAFGHWPPLFYITQALWGVLFGLSRTSVLVLMAVITAVCGAMVYLAVQTWCGSLYGAVFGFLFVTMPIVQLHTGTVMAETPLAVFTFGTVWLFADLSETPTRAKAVWCGLVLSAAILVKGDAWALVALVFCIPFLHSSPWRFVTRYGWIPLLFVAVLCAPFTLLTMKMTKDGWDQPWPGWAFFQHALPFFLYAHVKVVGVLLAVLAVLGAYRAVFRPLRTQGRAEPFWTCSLLSVAAVVLFHAIVPTSLETRKIFMSIPMVLGFASVGLKLIVDAAPKSMIPRAVYVLAITGFIGVPWIARPNSAGHRNMGAAAQEIIEHPALDRCAVLVASTTFDEREELSLVAEVAARERANFRHAVIRGGKLLADSSWTGADYKLLYTEPHAMRASLDAIPISAIIVYSGKVLRRNHATLVQELLAADVSEWQRQPDAAGATENIQFYLRLNKPSGPVRLPTIDLHRKLGRNVSAVF